MVNPRVLLVVKLALLLVVLAPFTGLGILGQQEMVVWAAALVALVVLVVKSRRARTRTP